METPDISNSQNSPASETDPLQLVLRSTGRGDHVQGPGALCWCALKPLWSGNASEILKSCLVSVMLHTGTRSTHRRVQTKSREVQPPFRLSRQDATHCTFHIIQGFEEKRENSSLKRMDCPSYLLLYWNFPQISPTFQQFCNFMQFCCIITAQRRKIQPVPRTQSGWPGKAASCEMGLASLACRAHTAGPGLQRLMWEPHSQPARKGGSFN